MIKVNVNGRSRYSIKPIEEQLSFDKARRGHPLFPFAAPAQHPTADTVPDYRCPNVTSSVDAEVENIRCRGSSSSSGLSSY